jgi:hypothetical protein
MSEQPDNRVPDITLERYRLKELSATEMARLEQRLGDDEDARHRLAQLAEDEAQLIADGRLAILETRVRQSLAARGGSQPRRRQGMIPAWAMAAAVAASVALAFAVPRMMSLRDSGEERIKGLEPSLTLYRSVGSGSETLADGAVAHRGDLIRVGYRAAGRAYGVILSIDGRGQVTVHLPGSGDQAATLGREATVLLDQAFELDDAPRFERFYFITANQPFALAPVVAAARRAAAAGGGTAVPLAVGAGLEQAVSSLLKESHP